MLDGIKYLAWKGYGNQHDGNMEWIMHVTLLLSNISLLSLKKIILFYKNK